MSTSLLREVAFLQATFNILLDLCGLMINERKEKKQEIINMKIEYSKEFIEGFFKDIPYSPHEAEGKFLSFLNKFDSKFLEYMNIENNIKILRFKLNITNNEIRNLVNNLKNKSDENQKLINTIIEKVHKYNEEYIQYPDKEKEALEAKNYSFIF